MPVYEYACAACDHHFEEWQKINDKPVRTCPKCKAKKVERLISATSFHLKGGGWYSDLYAGPKPKDASSKDGGSGDSGSGDGGAKDSGSKDSGSKDAGSKDGGSKDAKDKGSSKDSSAKGAASTSTSSTKTTTKSKKTGAGGS